jgi:hypothetical protein
MGTDRLTDRERERAGILDEAKNRCSQFWKRAQKWSADETIFVIIGKYFLRKNNSSVESPSSRSLYADLMNSATDQARNFTAQDIDQTSNFMTQGVHQTSDFITYFASI